MTWRPTIEDLCENYELDQRICEDDGDHYDDDDYKTFSFDLICMVEQEGLTDDNSYSRDRMAEVKQKHQHKLQKMQEKVAASATAATATAAAATIQRR